MRCPQRSPISESRQDSGAHHSAPVSLSRHDQNKLHNNERHLCRRAASQRCLSFYPYLSTCCISVKRIHVFSSSFAGSSSGFSDTPDRVALFDTPSILVSAADISASGNCMEQAASKNVMTADKQKHKKRLISDIPQRTLSVFQMGSRPSDRKGQCGWHQE